MFEGVGKDKRYSGFFTALHFYQVSSNSFDPAVLTYHHISLLSEIQRQTWIRFLVSLILHLCYILLFFPFIHIITPVICKLCVLYYILVFYFNFIFLHFPSCLFTLPHSDFTYTVKIHVFMSYWNGFYDFPFCLLFCFLALHDRQRLFINPLLFLSIVNRLTISPIVSLGYFWVIF